MVFRDDVADPEDLTQELQSFHGFRVGNHYGAVLKGFSGTMSPGIARALAAHPDVASVSPNLRAYASAQTVPTGVFRIEADLNPTDASNVDVAVVDTGIDLDHPQLNVQPGYNFLVDAGCAAPTSPGDDDHGHGTHVAGTIGAIDDNENVVGVAPGVRLIPYKVLCDNGAGTFSDIIAAIEHISSTIDPDPEIADTVVEVVNMSLSGIGHLPVLQTAIHNAVAQGVVFYVAASNESRDIYGNDDVLDLAPKNEKMSCLLLGKNCVGDTIPAAYPEVAAISAIDDANDNLASFSNFSANFDEVAHTAAGVTVDSAGAAIDLAAPGVGILSTDIGDNTDTSTKSGTSMASPHAAGAAALYIAQYGRAINAAGVDSIRQALINHAESLGFFVLGDADLNNEAILNANFDAVPPPPPVNEAPTAGFSWICGSNLICSFTDTSTDPNGNNTIVSRSWDFGDPASGENNTSSLLDPSHTYPAADSYQVMLTVTDGELGDSITKTVAVPADTPAAGAHISDLDGSSQNNGSTWTATATATVVDADGAPVSGATVHWNFTGGASGSDTCAAATDGNGQCSLSVGGIRKRNGSVTFSVSDVTGAGIYDANSNSDLEGDSDGTTITVLKP